VGRNFFIVFVGNLKTHLLEKLACSQRLFFLVSISYS